MTLAEAIQLIGSKRIDNSAPQQWADLGCGNGIFSKALLSLLHKDSLIYAIDRRPANFKEDNIHFIQKDFLKDALMLPPLDGIMMANALHFVQNKIAFLQTLRNYLLPGALFILVEYDTDTPNRYVPYPLSFASATELLKLAGFEAFEKINEHPSVYQRANMYAIDSVKR